MGSRRRADRRRSAGGTRASSTPTPSTRRRTFRDFLEHHGQAGQEPYAELGYATDALAEAGLDVERFAEYLRRVRCDDFCLFEPRLLGRRLPNGVGQALCALRHRGWKRKGFGARPRTRATFA